MPPKPRYTREQIVEAALDLVSEEGMEHLTAREIGKRLGSSSQPIFTAFKDMEELRGAVYAAASHRLAMFASQSAGYTSAFKQTGMLIILFAIQEPKLFQLLLMSEADEPTSFERMLELRGASPDVLISLVSSEFDLTFDEAKALFQHMWLYTYGIAVLCATKMCTFTEEELHQKIGANFEAMLTYIKEGRLDEQTPMPERVTPGSLPSLSSAETIAKTMV